jgi:hypothetical protein
MLMLLSGTFSNDPLSIVGILVIAGLRSINRGDLGEYLEIYPPIPIILSTISGGPKAYSPNFQ